ncbi:hypothetical protein GCM10027258_66190 [Amycolatopsis stemonae]
MFGAVLFGYAAFSDTLDAKAVASLCAGLACGGVGYLFIVMLRAEDRRALERTAPARPRERADPVTEYLRSPEFEDFDAWSARLALRVLVEDALTDPDVVAALAGEGLGQDDVRTSLFADDSLVARIRIEQDRLVREGIESTPVPRRRVPRAGEFFLLLAIAVAGIGYLVLLSAAWPRLPFPWRVVGMAGLIGVGGLSAGLVVRRAPDLAGMAGGQGEPQPHPELLRLGDRREALVAELVRPAIHEFARAHRSVRYGTKLAHTGESGLGESDGGEVVMTAGAERLRRIIERADSGAVALAGSRGVGKTTAIEAIRQGKLSTAGLPPLVVLASAPANYDARDFVLHLHALICQTVIERTSQALAPGLPRTQGERRAAVRRGLVKLVRVLGFTLVCLGGALLLWGVPVARFPGEIGGLAAAAVRDLPMSAQVLWSGQPVTHVVAASLILLAAWRLVSFAVLTPLSALVVFGFRRRHRALFELRRSAVHQLTRTRFLQTHTTGWSGKLTLPLKGEAGRTWSTQRAEQQLTHPEVVEELRSFAGKSARTLRDNGVIGRLVIAIDELDKIGEPEKAHQFVNDVKGVFGVPGCLFFVSVSDDAVLNFEQRGLGIRDAFDSAFSEMVRLEHFTLDESRQWVASRVAGVTEQFCYLNHCLSGGLPRELRRYTVEMLDVAAREYEPTLAAVTLALVRRDLAGKIHALVGLLGTFDAEPEHVALTARLLAIRDAVNPLELARMAADLVGETVETSVQPADVVRWNAGCFTLFCATLLDVFTDSLEHGALTEELHQLALARRQLPAHPQLAWQRIEDFRKAHNLDPGVDGRSKDGRRRQ